MCTLNGSTVKPCHCYHDLSIYSPHGFMSPLSWPQTHWPVFLLKSRKRHNDEKVIISSWPCLYVSISNAGTSKRLIEYYPWIRLFCTWTAWNDWCCSIYDWQYNWIKCYNLQVVTFNCLYICRRTGCCKSLIFSFQLVREGCENSLQLPAELILSVPLLLFPPTVFRAFLQVEGGERVFYLHH